MDLRGRRILFSKAALFVALGSLAGGLILLESPTLRTAALLALCVWAFARAYYFAFYVVTHYLDPGYRYAGLFDFARYALTGRRRPENDPKE